MILCITNQCNRNCAFCFEGAFKSGPTQRMSLADVERLCDFAGLSRPHARGVAVMGGEPTLHPELIDILQLLRRTNPRVPIHLLTNLLCHQDILHPLRALNVAGLVNVAGFCSYSSREQELLYENLDFLRAHMPRGALWLAVTIADEHQDFEFLYDMLRRDQPGRIAGLRIGISAPGVGFANDFPRDFSLGFGEKYLEVVETCHRLRPTFAFENECFVNMCMMSARVFSRLEGVVKNLNSYCLGNVDILPDFSAHWCFAFEGAPEMSIRSIFDYSGMDEVRDALQRKAAEMEKVLGVQCDTTHCTSLKCRGPCPAVKYYRKFVRG